MNISGLSDVQGFFFLGVLMNRGVGRIVTRNKRADNFGHVIFTFKHDASHQDVF